MNYIIYSIVKFKPVGEDEVVVSGDEVYGESVGDIDVGLIILLFMAANTLTPVWYPMYITKPYGLTVPSFINDASPTKIFLVPIILYTITST